MLALPRTVLEATCGLMSAVLHAVSAVGAVLAMSFAVTGCSIYDPALIENVPAKAADVPRMSMQPPPASSCGQDSCTKLPDATATNVEQDAGGQSWDEVDATVDACPTDESKTEPGICGCGDTDVDSDLDGTYDCADDCPQDPAKTARGTCGCGLPDVDSDADGTGDCMDLCPRDARKTTNGACGCGVTDDDRDSDGTADCVDSCPDDLSKTEPGACGCAQQDPANRSAGAIYCAKSALRHRYSFDSVGDTALDSVSGADARLVNALQQDGTLALAGDLGDGVWGEAYSSLPIELWASLSSVTIEVWFIWRGVGDAGASEWQRIFDVGRQQDDGMTRYWFLTPHGRGGVRTAFSLGGPIEQEVSVTSLQPARRDVAEHVACVVDAQTWTLSLFSEGMLQGSVMLPGTLSDLAPDSLWLGRSHFDYDPAFHGEILEFRIYDAALSSQQLQASAAAGPDYDFAP